MYFNSNVTYKGTQLIWILISNREYGETRPFCIQCVNVYDCPVLLNVTSTYCWFRVWCLMKSELKRFRRIRHLYMFIFYNLWDIKPGKQWKFYDWVLLFVIKYDLIYAEFNPCTVRLNPHEVRLSWMSKSSEQLIILVWMKGTFGGHLWSTAMLSAILNVSHYQKSHKLLTVPYH